MVYHIFTNNTDEYLTDKKEAVKLFQEWAKEYGCARLYESKTIDEDGDCIMSEGEYPL